MFIALIVPCAVAITIFIYIEMSANKVTVFVNAYHSISFSLKKMQEAAFETSLPQQYSSSISSALRYLAERPVLPGREWRVRCQRVIASESALPEARN